MGDHNREENFVYSKLMNWVALDRGIRLADKRSFPGNRAHWLQERDSIYKEVMNKLERKTESVHAVLWQR